MPLTAPRFAGDPELESLLTGHRMLAPHRGPAVQKIQEALLDLGYPLPARGADGEFGSETGEAVTQFKTNNGIYPNDPVVGQKTMEALDVACRDKPPAPFSERDEWLSWLNRAAVPNVGHFNFTRQSELARRHAGISYTFDAHSAWLPMTYQTALVQGLTALLDPFGSPSGIGLPAATWGVGPFDLYHCHVVVWTGGAQLIATELQDDQLSLHHHMDALRNAVVAPGAAPFNAAWSAAYSASLLASPVMGQAHLLAEKTLSLATPAQPTLLVWHTFERSRWRPGTMLALDPRRHWNTQLAPVLSPVIPFPYVTHHDLRTYTHHLFEIGFLVSQQAVITAMPGSGIEAACVAGLAYDDVSALA